MKNKNGFFGKPAVTVGIMISATLLAKVLGMLRSVLLASHYGTGTAAAAFSAASRIPLSFFDLLFSASILGCFIPVYNGFSEDKKGAHHFAQSFLSVILAATGLLSLFGILLARPLIALIAPGLDTGTAALAVRLLRLMFPMVIFTGATYTLVGIMQSKGRFILPALISSVSNAGVILYFVFLDGRLGEYSVFGLAAAYLVSWILQLLTLAVPLFGSGSRFAFRPDLRDPALKKAVKMSVPIMLGSWLPPIGLIAGTFFSTLTLPSGNVIFEYAVNIFTIAAGILTYSICNYIFPSLSRLSDDPERFCEEAKNGIISTAAIVLPFTAALTILSGECVSVLYQRGNFTAEDARITADVIRTISVSMPAFAANEVFSRICYARSMPSVPMISAVCGAAADIAFAAVSVCLCGGGIGSVGYAYSFGFFVSAVIMVVCTFVKNRGLRDKTFTVSFFKVFAASAAASAVMVLISRLIGSDAFSAGILKNILTASAVFVPAALIYLLLLRVLRIIGTGNNKQRKDRSRN